MQLLSVGVARSVWLFDLNELNPTGKSLFPEILLWAGEKYSFQAFPKTISEIDEKTKSYLFKMGQFHTQDGAINVNLSFYNDGLVAESWASTAKTDEFLEDLIRSASQEYGLIYRPDMIRSKRYVSELNARLDFGLNSINPRIARFSEMLSGMFRAHNLPPFELTGMVFGLDSSAHSYKPHGFTVERKLGAPFSENRFWSQSPFTTSDHLQALSEFENLLADS
jgi:hypothetical protein